MALLAGYTYWWELRVTGMMFFMCVCISFLKHFLTIKVGATRWKSLRLVVIDLFGTGTMVAVLKHLGTAAYDKDILKMLVNTSAS